MRVLGRSRLSAYFKSGNSGDTCRTSGAETAVDCTVHSVHDSAEVGGVHHRVVPFLVLLLDPHIFGILYDVRDVVEASVCDGCTEIRHMERRSTDLTLSDG